MVTLGKSNPIQLQRFLKGMDYPASNDELVHRAKDNGADETVLEALRALPGPSVRWPERGEPGFRAGWTICGRGVATRRHGRAHS
jgi:hypothetical protein